MSADGQSSRALVCISRGQDWETEVTVARLRRGEVGLGRRAGFNGPVAPVDAYAAAEPGHSAPAKPSGAVRGTLADENYRLGGGDLLRIRFYDRHDRAGLDGDYLIGESGQLRLPRIGEFDARDRTVSALEREIRIVAGNRGEWLGCFSIDVAQCRPFYIAGLVESPGSYPYVPGYTVLHAVCMAGGLRNAPLDAAAGSLRGQRILAEAMDRLAELAARRARLEAERDNADAICLPEELAEPEPVRAGELIEAERKLLQRFRDAARRERTGLEAVIQLLSAEVESYRAGIARAEKRIQEQMAASGRLKALHALGQIDQRPLLEADAALDAAERCKQEALTGFSRAGIEMERARRELTSLALSAAARAAEEIVRTDREIARLKAVVAEARELAEAHEYSSGEGRPGLSVTYRIMRRSKTGEVFFERAGETTPILPGDVIQIERQSAPRQSGLRCASAS